MSAWAIAFQRLLRGDIGSIPGDLSTLPGGHVLAHRGRDRTPRSPFGRSKRRSPACSPRGSQLRAFRSFTLRCSSSKPVFARDARFATSSPLTLRRSSPRSRPHTSRRSARARSARLRRHTCVRRLPRTQRSRSAHLGVSLRSPLGPRLRERAAIAAVRFGMFGSLSFPLRPKDVRLAKLPACRSPIPDRAPFTSPRRSRARVLHPPRSVRSSRLQAPSPPGSPACADKPRGAHHRAHALSFWFESDDLAFARGAQPASRPRQTLRLDEPTPIRLLTFATHRSAFACPHLTVPELAPTVLRADVPPALASSTCLAVIEASLAGDASSDSGRTLVRARLATFTPVRTASQLTNIRPLSRRTICSCAVLQQPTPPLALRRPRS